MMLSLGASQGASAGTIRRGFRVGATVIASASLSSRTVASGGAIEVRATGTRGVTPALVIDGRVRPMDHSPALLTAPDRGEAVVTLIY
jgi:hypothetical protein